MQSLPTLAFLFIESAGESDLPVVYLYARRHARGTFGAEDVDKAILTQASTTWQDFEYELDRLQGELEEIRREAQLRFADAAAKKTVLPAVLSDIAKTVTSIESPT
jgi:hypothetical protein